MLRQHLLLVVLLACACAGCQSLFAQREDPPVALDDSPSEPQVDALAENLDRDLWHQNQHWSAIAESRSRIDGVPAVNRLRWLHPQSHAVEESGKLAELELVAEEEFDSPEDISTDPNNSTADPLGFLPWKSRKDRVTRQVPVRLPPTARYRELSLLALRNDLPGWNAAILWAQLDPINARGIAPVLNRLVEHPPVYAYDPTAKPNDPASLKADKKTPLLSRKSQPISVPMQCAAAEAWCLVLAHATHSSESPMELPLQSLQTPKLDERVWSELILGIARKVPPKEIPGLTDALQDKLSDKKTKKGPSTTRRAAIEACTVFALNQPHRSPRTLDGSDTPDLWPDSIWNLQWDDDPRVRIALGELLTVTAHPKCFEILKKYVSDSDLQVRQSALVGLGRLGTPAAKEELQKQVQRKEEPIRAAAVGGLAAWGPSEIVGYAKDTSHLVRREIAIQLGQFHSPVAAGALRQLIGDPSAEVQSAVLEAIEPWPNELAMPLLIQALRDSSFKTRKLCLLQLEGRGSTVVFPLQASRSERMTAADALAENWKFPSELSARLQSAPSQTPPDADMAHVIDIKERLEAFAQAAPSISESSSALDWLRQLTLADVPVVEQLIPTVTLPQAEVLFREVLARLNPVYRAVLELEHPDVQSRRRAAEILAQHASAASLPSLAVRRMREPLVQEQDRLVWRFIMAAVQNEDTPDCADIALLAVNHNWPDIRVLGCGYIAYHGRHVHAVWLLPLFADPNPSVQIAAVRAAAKCHNPIVLDGQRGSDGTNGLRPLLTSTNTTLRLAAAACMSQFGDAQAMQELNRLSLDEIWMVRRQAVEAMGASGQTRFIENLVRVAWTESNSGVKHAVVASLAQLVAESDLPQGLAATNSLQQNVEVWVSWWEDQKRLQAERNLTDSQTIPYGVSYGARAIEETRNP